MHEKCPICGENRHWHTKSWYQKNMKVDPERLKIKALETENPHYRSAAKMKLYAECSVQEGIKQHPEFIIKPRSQLQKEASKKLVEINRDQAKILQMIDSRNDSENHALWHYLNGLHLHTEGELEEIMSCASRVNTEVNDARIKFENKWHKKPWQLTQVAK